MKKLYVVGIGPGGKEHRTPAAEAAILDADIVVGYTPYLGYVEDLLEGKETFATGMTGEIERCKQAISFAMEGKTTAIVSTGDAGLYGMAGPILELAPAELEVVVVPGVSSQFAAAALLGAPLMNDVATISLSDYLTPQESIDKRLHLAGEGDFVVALYNPRSKARPHSLDDALEILRKYRSGDTPVGIVKNAGREGTEIIHTTLQDIDTSLVTMMAIVLVGNSSTKFIHGAMVTARGYNV